MVHGRGLVDVHVVAAQRTVDQVQHQGNEVGVTNDGPKEAFGQPTPGTNHQVNRDQNHQAVGNKKLNHQRKPIICLDARGKQRLNAAQRAPNGRDAKRPRLPGE